jgi:hypothetical protein
LNNPFGFGLDKVNNVFQNSVGIDPVKPFVGANDNLLSKFTMNGIMTDINASKSEAETNANAREAAEVAEKAKKEAAEAELAKVRKELEVAETAKKEAEEANAKVAAYAKTKLEELKQEISTILTQKGTKKTTDRLTEIKNILNKPT